jgi:hypothetical protein
MKGEYQMEGVKNDNPKSTNSESEWQRRLEKIKQSQDYADKLSGKDEDFLVKARKPKEEFFRVHRGDSHRLIAGIYIDQQNFNQPYLVMPDAIVYFEGTLVKHVELIMCVNTTCQVFLWPLPIPNPARSNDWHISARKAAKMAEDQWVRIQSDMQARQYLITTAKSDLGDPSWPNDKTMADLLEEAFKNYVIEEPDHPIILRLQGRVDS